MNSPAVLVATFKLRPGQEGAFASWQMRVNELVAKAPGYLSSDMLPSKNPGDRTWMRVLHFQTQESLLQWQQSPERARMMDEVLPLLESGKLEETVSQAKEENGEVTQLILSKIKPGMESDYRAWSVKIQEAQAKYPGYCGMYLQPPSTGPGGHWTTMLRYDTQEHLEAWLNAPERTVLLRESEVFVEDLELMRPATSFPGWVPVDPETGKGPPNWKAALLVLLGLFPIVMLEMRFLSPLLRELHLSPSVATFLGNFLSVFLTGCVTMPFFVRRFHWWLFAKGDSASGTTTKGVLFLSGLFVIEIALCWWLL